jgi:hypothetical protein
MRIHISEHMYKVLSKFPGYHLALRGKVHELPVSYSFFINMSANVRSIFPRRFLKFLCKEIKSNYQPINSAFVGSQFNLALCLSGAFTTLLAEI